MLFITLSSYDTINCIRLFEESGIIEDPTQFTESEHRTYQKLQQIRLAQETKHRLNQAQGPKEPTFEQIQKHIEKIEEAENG